MRVGAVIAAAAGERKQSRALWNIGDLSLAERVVINLQRAGVKDIVMVTGYQAEQVEKSLYHFGLTFLRDEHYETNSMWDSVKIGLQYLYTRCEQILICPVEVAFFSEDTVKALLEQEGSLIRPLCHQQLGYPICVEAAQMASILQGEQEMEEWNIRALVVEDEGTIVAAENGTAEPSLVELHNVGLMRPQVKVRLIHRRPFFGPGSVTLLKQIERLGSVREACEKTGISYSKGWSMIHVAEEELGYAVVERQPGGKHGGKAQVTAKGLRLLEFYEQYERAVEEAANQLYEQMFEGKEGQ